MMVRYAALPVRISPGLLQPRGEHAEDVCRLERDPKLRFAMQPAQCGTGSLLEGPCPQELQAEAGRSESRRGAAGRVTLGADRDQSTSAAA
jgi:hypothetical protein